MKENTPTTPEALVTLAVSCPDPGGICRERLLSAATSLFARHGYEATTVRQIVSAAEVTAPVLYYHFGSKEGLLLGVVQIVYQKVHDIADHAICQCGSVRQGLCNFADELSVFVQERPEIGRLFGLIQLGAFPVAQPAVIALYAAGFREKVRSIVREGIKRGEFRSDTSETLTWAILGAVSVGFQSNFMTSWASEQEGLKNVLGTIFHGNEAE